MKWMVELYGEFVEIDGPQVGEIVRFEEVDGVDRPISNCFPGCPPDYMEIAIQTLLHSGNKLRVRHLADLFMVSRQTAWKWVNRLAEKDPSVVRVGPLWQVSATNVTH